MFLRRGGSIIVSSGRVDVAVLDVPIVSTVESKDMATTTPSPSEPLVQHDGTVEH
jgi:hypothetical protein